MSLFPAWKCSSPGRAAQEHDAACVTARSEPSISARSLNVALFPTSSSSIRNPPSPLPLKLQTPLAASTLALQHDGCPRQAHSSLFTLLSAAVTTHFSEVYCLVFSTHQYLFLLLSVCARCIAIKRICQTKNLHCYICISLA